MIFGIFFAYWSLQKARQLGIERGVSLIASLDENDDNRLLLIRTINHLHSLGQEDAIVALERFIERHPYDALQGQTKVFNIETVVPLLFQPRNKFPAHTTTVEIVNGIPMDTEWRFKFNTGLRFPNIDLIEWARNDARIRKEPLLPTNEVFKMEHTLVERLLENEQKTMDQNNPRAIDRMKSGIQWAIRRQIYTLLEELVPNIQVSDNKEWELLVNTCESHDLYWNRTTQKYEFDGP